MKQMLKRLVLLAAVIAAPVTAAHAGNDVALTSAVFVEKTVAEGGQSRVVLEQPKLVVPGDRLVFVLSYTNRGGTPASDFVVTNPLPGAVAFQAAEDRAAVVSVDGGRAWGPLASLRIKESDGSVRGARPEDVTHVRWTFARAIPAGQGGKLSFRGIVR